MSIHDDAPFAVLDREFFVPFDRRSPGPELLSVVSEVLPPGEWQVIVQGMWTHVHPAGWTAARQGWKLHVSTLPENAATVVRTVAGVLKDDPAGFKFASDRRILDLILTKNWPRQGGGKFITIYPSDEAHFRRLAAALAEATAGFDGPYILSDNRVPGSRVVFYRYGEHLANETVSIDGQRTTTLAAPSGEEEPEQRRGYYRLPEWVADPWGAATVHVLRRGEETVRLNGRFEVHSSVKFSNVGGVYRGWDLERDEPVVIRERRPYYGWVDLETDCVALLHKEARILREMDGTGWTPRYVDAFQLWEHHYLVMEAVQAIPLRDFAASQYMRRRTVASPRALFFTFRRLLLQLLEGMEEFHRRGIILRDLTPANVLVRRDGSVCFIDLEFAWERQGDQPYLARMHTEGYGSPGQVAGDGPTEADDCYALGAVLVEMCAFVAGGLGLNPAGTLATAEMMMAEVGLPRELLDVARGLLHPDPSARWSAADVRRALGAVPPGAIPWRPREPGRTLPPAVVAREPIAADAAATCEAVCRFLEASAEPDRNDALWPASPQMYRANPVCILFGACGPLEAVRRMRGASPDAWLDWVERRATPERCPPGLYTGLAGVALTLAAHGRVEPARRMLLAALESPLLSSTPDLYYGAAGVGLAALALGGDELLGAAARIGDELRARGQKQRRGMAWPAADGFVPCGLAAGASGIALFYTYLGACTGRRADWSLARQALEFDLAQGSMRGGYAYWPDAAGRFKRYWSPHVSFGSAGVGTAAARLFACTGDERVRALAERCGRSLTFRWTNKLWQDMGYAGWGETLLDLYAATGDAGWRDHALRMAEVILPARVETRFGVAFPGLGWNRVTCDFGMGASGIALFLHRLAHGGHRAFFPDHLLAGWPAASTAAGTREQTVGMQAEALSAAEGAAGAGRTPGTGGAASGGRPGRPPARARVRTPA